MSREPLESTESAALAIKRVSYSHDMIIDYIIANPGKSRREVALHHGYTEAWLSRIMNSDAFNVVLARRREEMVDPTIVATVKENLTNVAQRSMEILLKKLENPTQIKLEDAIKCMDVATKALGYGAREASNVTNIQQNVVVVPPKSSDAEEWANTYNPVSAERL